MKNLANSAIWLQNRLEVLACYVSASAVAVMMMITAVEVVSRALFYKSVPGAYEYVSLLFVYLIYLGLGYSQRRDAHITIGIVYDHLPRRARKMVQGTFLLVAFLFFGALTWTSAVSAWTNFTMGDTVLGVIEVKTWWARAGIPVGLALLSFRFLNQLCRLISCDELCEETASRELVSLETPEKKEFL